jgi:Superinfection immunity protein
MTGADIMDILAIIIVVTLFLALYFLPFIIARRKNHPNKIAIFICNLVFAGTGLGWLICMIWAISFKVTQSVISVEKLS